GDGVGPEPLHLLGQLPDGGLGATGELRAELLPERGRLLRLGPERVLELLNLRRDLRHLAPGLLLRRAGLLQLLGQGLGLLLGGLALLLLASQRRLQLRSLVTLRLEADARLLVRAPMLLELALDLGSPLLDMGPLLQLCLELPLEHFHPLA